MAALKIAGVQMACGEEKKKNLEKAIRLIELAAERGARLVCLQELFNTFWFPKEVGSAAFRLAEPVGGEAVSTLRELAKRTGAGGLWIAWPKQSSGVASDVTQTEVRRLGLASGLVDYKICSVDRTWSGLQFARRGAAAGPRSPAPAAPRRSRRRG